MLVYQRVESLDQWIGLRENLNRKPWIFPLNMGLSCKFSHHPILWTRKSPENHRWKKECMDDMDGCFASIFQKSSFVENPKDILWSYVEVQGYGFSSDLIHCRDEELVLGPEYLVNSCDPLHFETTGESLVSIQTKRNTLFHSRLSCKRLRTAVCFRHKILWGIAMAAIPPSRASSTAQMFWKKSSVNRSARLPNWARKCLATRINTNYCKIFFQD